MPNQYGSSHARPDPPKRKPGVARTTPGDPLRDAIRKTPKRVQDQDEPETRRAEDSRNESGEQKEAEERKDAD